LGVDREKLLLQADKLEEGLRRLGDVGRRTVEEFVRDDMAVAAAERRIQVSVECCLNIGNHIIAGLGLKRADSYVEVFGRLAEGGVISQQLGEELKKAARFRNRVVHIYVDLKPEEAHQFCVETAPHLASFVETVFAWLKTRGHLG
jgi:uncharacterized protein YutE (UPF0331/DUF86 family)